MPFGCASNSSNTHLFQIFLTKSHPAFRIVIIWRGDSEHWRWSLVVFLSHQSILFQEKPLFACETFLPFHSLTGHISLNFNIVGGVVRGWFLTVDSLSWWFCLWFFKGDTLLLLPDFFVQFGGVLKLPNKHHSLRNIPDQFPSCVQHSRHLTC